MKYARLTKEQFEELHQEFINFLATQSITADEWKDLKASKPEIAEQELDVFSDLVWEGVLNRVEYLENISEKQMYLFFLEESVMHLIAVKVGAHGIDLMTSEGFAWLRENLHSDAVEMMTAQKKYGKDKNADKFQLIQLGAVITKGELYRWFYQLINLHE